MKSLKFVASALLFFFISSSSIFAQDVTWDSDPWEDPGLGGGATMSSIGYIDPSTVGGFTTVPGQIKVNFKLKKNSEGNWTNNSFSIAKAQYSSLPSSASVSLVGFYYNSVGTTFSYTFNYSIKYPTGGGMTTTQYYTESIYIDLNGSTPILTTSWW